MAMKIPPLACLTTFSHTGPIGTDISVLSCLSSFTPCCNHVQPNGRGLYFGSQLRKWGGKSARGAKSVPVSRKKAMVMASWPPFFLPFYSSRDLSLWDEAPHTESLSPFSIYLSVNILTNMVKGVSCGHLRFPKNQVSFKWTLTIISLTNWMPKH